MNFTNDDRQVRQQPDNTLETMNVEQLFNGYYTPITDVKETTESLIIEVELPGVKNDDIVIEIGNGVLDIRGDHTQQTIHRQLPLKSIRKERIFGKFKKSVPISYDVSSSEVNASFRDGLLIVEIPKPKRRMSGKKQKVKVN